MKINVDLIYPIGSTYASSVNVSPQDIFGGTWTAVTNKQGVTKDSTLITHTVPGSSWTSLRKLDLTPGNWLVFADGGAYGSGLSATIRLTGGTPESRQSFHCSDGNLYSAETECLFYTNTNTTVYLQIWSASGRNMQYTDLWAYKLDGISPLLYVWKRTA